MAQHTPGPWVVGNLAPNGAYVVHYGGPDHHWHIADVFGQVDEAEPRATRHGYASGNARLIAAAPELLDVARMLVGSRDASAPRFGISDCVMRARHAIAKAEGRT